MVEGMGYMWVTWNEIYLAECKHLADFVTMQTWIQTSVALVESVLLSWDYSGKATQTSYSSQTSTSTRRIFSNDSFNHLIDSE